MHHDSAADRGFDIELKIEEGLYMTKDLFIDFYRYINAGCFLCQDHMPADLLTELHYWVRRWLDYVLGL